MSILSIVIVVINRCNFELATKFGNWWFWIIRPTCEAVGVPYTDLDGPLATKANFDKALKAGANFICGVGHGAGLPQPRYSGQGYEVLIDTTDPNDLTLLRGKSGSFLSCAFGQGLPALIAAGMLSVDAYRETVTFCFADANNIADPNALYFGEAFRTYPITYIQEREKGVDVVSVDQRAYEASQAMYQKNYEKARYPDVKQFLMVDKILEVHAAQPEDGQPQPQPGIDKVYLYVDGNKVAEATTPTSGTTYEISRTLQEGPHVLQASAWSKGLEYHSSLVNIKVTGTAQGIVKVSILNPTEGQEAPAGTITVQIDAHVE